MTNKTLQNGWYFLGYGAPREFDLSDVPTPAPTLPTPPPTLEHWHYGRLEPWQFCDACGVYGDDTVVSSPFGVTP
jgi:hypothetical protein